MCLGKLTGLLNMTLIVLTGPLISKPTNRTGSYITITSMIWFFWWKIHIAIHFCVSQYIIRITVYNFPFSVSLQTCQNLDWRNFKHTKHLTLILLFTTTSTFANSVDPDQVAPEEAIWSGSTLYVIQFTNLKTLYDIIWLADSQKWVWLIKLFSRIRVNIRGSGLRGLFLRENPFVGLYLHHCLKLYITFMWATTLENIALDMFTQENLKSTSASAHSDQSICCTHEETLQLWLTRMRPVMIQTVQMHIWWSAHIQRVMAHVSYKQNHSSNSLHGSVLPTSLRSSIRRTFFEVILREIFYAPMIRRMVEGHIVFTLSVYTCMCTFCPVNNFDIPWWILKWLGRTHTHTHQLPHWKQYFLWHIWANSANDKLTIFFLIFPRK